MGDSGQASQHAPQLPARRHIGRDATAVARDARAERLRTAGASVTLVDKGELPLPFAQGVYAGGIQVEDDPSVSVPGPQFEAIRPAAYAGASPFGPQGGGEPVDEVPEKGRVGVQMKAARSGRGRA